MPITFTPYQGGPPANAVRSFTNVPYYTVFTPLSVPTCQLWLDAADASTITGTNPITAWTDKSGKGRSVTITSGPTYGSTKRNGINTLIFNNNQITTSIASAVGTGDFTLIAVWYQNVSGTNTVLSLGTSASSSQSLGFSGNKYNFYQYGSAQESAYSSSAGSWVIQIGTRISSVKAVYINGVAGTTPSTDSLNVTDTTVIIGKGDTFPITGELGEILIYTGTITSSQQQTLESYLAQKWGLTATLPRSHLHYTFPAGLPSIIYVPIVTYSSPPPLYSFTSFTFTNAAATLQSGPILSQCLTAYSGTSWLSQYFTMTTQGYQLWTVPYTGSYTVICAGASCVSPTNAVGYGYGAIVAAKVSLTRGQQIQILVGQMGDIYQSASAGGGGSFVASGITPSAGVCISAGGGGGGKSTYTPVSSLQNGTSSTSGNASGEGVAGGTNGSGGVAPFNYGHGGAGFIGNGNDSTGSYFSGGITALSFLNGGVGGKDGAYTMYGGFGGGGAGNGAYLAGGGGGGYSGGGGSGASPPRSGGGGGSYPSNCVLLGLNLGQGYVTIMNTTYSQIPSGGSISISSFTSTSITIVLGSMTNIISYMYYITTSGSSIASPIYSGNTLSPSTITISHTLTSGTYYAALVGANTVGSSSPIFSAAAILPGSIATVTLSSLSSTGGTLTWNTSSSATGYNWYVGTGYGTGVIASGTTNSSTTSVNFSYSLTNSYYYGWVQGTTSTASGSLTYSPPIYYTVASGTLYSFTSFTFTNAGVTGRYGPTLSQCQSAYSGTSWATGGTYLTMTTQGYQLWTVPSTGTYTVVCAGAATIINPYAFYGYGAIIATTLSLSVGQQIQILVGQQSETDTSYSGGGGGTFFATGITPIGGSCLVAGGGGGGWSGSGSGITENGSSNTSGNASSDGIAGGSNGYGGSVSTNWGFSGAGFIGNGLMSLTVSTGSVQALSFINGGVGGFNSYYSGGFGGGGAQNNGYGCGGGAGGYSGGGGAGVGNGGSGGGGGSFPSGSTFLGYNQGQGFVYVYSGTYNSVPSDASISISSFSLSGVTLSITPVANAFLYDYYLTTSGSSIATPINSGTTRSTTISISITLSIASTYYAAVVSKNTYGSGNTVFTSAYAIPGDTIVCFSSISTSSATLTWTAATYASSYTWIISTQSAGGGVIASGTTSSLTSGSVSVSLSSGTAYYGRVTPSSTTVTGATYVTGATKPSGAVSFTYVGYIQAYVPQSGTSSVTVILTGGGGGGGGYNIGGAGAYVNGTMAVTGGTTYYIIVGGGGDPSTSAGVQSSVSAFGGGGIAFPSGNYCGNGGGRSAIQQSLGTDLVDAGGGGGSGYTVGGSGGSVGTAGGGATGGAGGTLTGGPSYQGSNGAVRGSGGGGGGYIGGSSAVSGGGGGGGGSSLTSSLTGVTVTTGGGGASGSYYAKGTNGYITIT